MVDLHSGKCINTISGCDGQGCFFINDSWAAQPPTRKESNMARFGGNEFTTFSVPLAFEGRYFILESGDPPRVSVVRDDEGAPVFEVMRNEPVDNPLSEVTKTAAGVVTVSDKTGKFLYKVRPHYETSVVFGKIDGGKVSARITDRNIQVGGITLENNVFSGAMAGVVVRADGSVAIGASIPPALLRWFQS